MEMHKVMLSVWIDTFAVLGIVWGDVNLTPTTVLVDENNPVTLTFAYTGSGTVVLFTWYAVVGDVGGTDDTLIGRILPSSCSAVGSIIPDATKYIYSCVSDKQMSWTIKNVDRSNEGDKWACAVTTTSILFSDGVSIGVRVPIQSVSMTLPSSDATLDVVENTLQRFKCSTDGGLPIADIIWYKDNGTPGITSDDINIRANISESQTQENGLKIRRSTLSFYPSRLDGGSRIYCSAHNNENQAPINSTRKPLLNILFGPDVLPMSNQTAEEGKPFRYNCSFTPGNPAETTVKWTRNDVQVSWNSGNVYGMLEFVNVSKNDKMRYICTVQNIMQPTGKSPVSEQKSGYFYLEVIYKASIEEFVIEGHTGHEVTVNEFTSPEIVCNVDSYPASNIKVLFRTQTLAEESDALQLKHQLPNVSCGDIGVYTCTGRNYLNMQALSTKDIVLLVKCQPQTFGDIDYTVYSVQHKPATLRLSALAFPMPSSIVWKRIENKDERVLNNNTQLTITMNLVKQTGIHIDIIQLELKFHDVTQSDFGQYKVQISNSMGTMEKTFALETGDVPDAPTNLMIIPGTVTETSVVIQWNPGLNGGLAQTFVVMYWKDGDAYRKVDYMHDTNTQQQNFTITQLNQDTNYNVQVYAFNSEGSGALTRKAVAFKTQIGVTTQDDDSGGPVYTVIGASVGSVLAIAVIFIVTVFVVRRVLIRNNTNNGRKESVALEQTQRLPTLATRNDDPADAMTLSERHESTQYEELQRDVDVSDNYSSICQEQGHTDKNTGVYINTTLTE